MSNKNGRNMDFVNFKLSDHFKKRALQRFGIEKSIVSRWSTNIMCNGTRQKCPDGNYSIIYQEVKIIADVESRTIVTCFPVNDVEGLLKLVEKGKENEETNMAVRAITIGVAAVVREKNKKISKIINAIKDMEDVHTKTTRIDYYRDQEKQIDKMYEKLDEEMVEKRTISDVLQRVHIN